MTDSFTHFCIRCNRTWYTAGFCDTGECAAGGYDFIDMSCQACRREYNLILHAWHLEDTTVYCDGSNQPYTGAIDGYF